MGWMNDMLSYISLDPLWRNYHHDTLTFSMVYAFSENFMLPISHDEVVYGKGSLINKMPGDYDMKFSGVRGFVAYMMAHPGKKLMFMGSEIGQFDEWNANEELEWNLLSFEKHRQLNHFFAEANKFYRDVPAMHENDYDWDGFQWIALDDYKNSIISFRRIAYDGSEIICVCNFQPVQHDNYVVGVPEYGIYEEVFNSEAEEFGGCGIRNEGELKAKKKKDHELNYSMEITVPPLAVMYFKLKKKLALPVKKKTTAKKDAALAKLKAEKAKKSAKAAPKKEDKAEKVKVEAKSAKAEATAEKVEKKAEPAPEKPVKKAVKAVKEKTSAEVEKKAEKTEKAVKAEKVEKTETAVKAESKTVKAEKPAEKKTTAKK
jgi:1,4-alpha-glucan-branching enzyme 1